MLVQAGLESKTPRRDRRGLRGGLPRRRSRGQHPAGARLPASDRAHPRDDRARRAPRGPAGLAYASTQGNLYYAVASFPGYGRLSGNTLDDLRAGTPGRGGAGQARSGRLRALEGGRDGPRPAAGRTDRWGEGFPGWHLECSAMARRYLGDRFDIHTGGIDNVFPHHEDEIAQSAPLVGGRPRRLWVHGEHLLMGGRKMAKSAGNFQRVTELVERGLDPLAFRYLVLTSRYARKLNYTDASVDAAAAALESLRAGSALGPPPIRRAVGGPGRRSGPRLPAIDRQGSPRPWPGSVGRRTSRSESCARAIGAAVARGSGTPRPVRGRARRRPRPADRAGRRPRDPPGRPRAPTSAAGWSSTPIAVLGLDLDRRGRMDGRRSGSSPDRTRSRPMSGARRGPPRLGRLVIAPAADALRASARATMAGTSPTRPTGRASSLAEGIRAL